MASAIVDGVKAEFSPAGKTLKFVLYVDEGTAEKYELPANESGDGWATVVETSFVTDVAVDTPEEDQQKLVTYIAKEARESLDRRAFRDTAQKMSYLSAADAAYIN